MINLINNLPQIYREDKFINDLYSGTKLSLDEIESHMVELEKNYWFDSIDEKFIPLYEKALGIKTNPNNSIEDRRAFVEAKWKSSGKADLVLIQAVCNSWKNGDVTASFTDGKIQLKFIGEKGIPKDLEGLKQALEDIKPAHLALSYLFAYLLIQDIHNKMKISEMQSHKINEFAFNSL